MAALARPKATGFYVYPAEIEGGLENWEFYPIIELLHLKGFPQPLCWG